MTAVIIEAMLPPTWSRHTVMKVLLKRMQNCVSVLVANVWLSMCLASWKMEEMIINSAQSILQSELNQLGKNRATDHFYGFLVLPEHIGSTSCCQFVFIDTASIVAW